MTEATDLEELPELVLLPAGSRFGNYIVHECIGQGAMGNVYRAQHALLEKPVALKVMDASLLASADARARFLREGQAAAAIKHPNVVDITDVGVFDGTPFLVMELLEGEDLQVYLERGRELSEREIAALLIPIAAALGAAHDRGVLHRDLKPSNIFLSRGSDGEVIPKILDFGISKIAQAVTSRDFESTPFNQLLGSPMYLPPEAVRGSRQFTPKSDQYSLGVVLYECVTGQAPFAASSLMALLNAISAGEFAAPSRVREGVSPAMERAILRAMNPDPALRFEHVRELGRDLLEVAGARTRMLWGRTFGRIDLAEVLPESTSAASALLRLPRQEPIAPARRVAAHVQGHGWIGWTGAAALAAGLVVNAWALRGGERSSTSTVAPLSRLPDGRAPVAAVHAGVPGPLVFETADEKVRAPPAPPAPPRREAPAPAPEASPVERPRLVKRPRAPSAPEPPAARAPREARETRAAPPAPRPRVVRLPTEPVGDDIGELFAMPGEARAAAPSSPDAAARGVAARPAPAVGANESPILD